jgi:hypothetical protein
MAHVRCTACRIRAWSADAATEPCPSCGAPLEAVERAEELIGFRTFGPSRDAGWSLADHVRATIARNDAARARRLQRAHRPTHPSE